MPNYYFICSSCKEEYQEFLSPKDFIKIKSQKILCEECLGIVLPKIIKINSEIEKNLDQIKVEISEEKRKTLEKISQGDLKTIMDVYGDRPNPYKHKEKIYNG